MTNAARPTDIDKAKLAAERSDACLSWVLSDARGRQFVWELMGRFKLHEQTYSPNNSEHCFNAGVRNAGILVLNDVLRVSPTSYLTAQAEAMERSKLATEPTDEGEST